MHESNIGIPTIEELLRDGIIAKEGKNFPTAAALFTKAIIDSEAISYQHGVLHGLMNLGEIWRLKTRETGKSSFARLARLSSLEALDYAREEQMDREEVIHATFLLGQAEFELGNIMEATSLYKEAYDYYREHPRSTAHLGNVQRHLGTALVKVGNREEGIAMMEEGLEDIRTFDETEAFDKRNYVWEAGALLALSDAYAVSNPKKARQFAEEALEIAKGKDLTIRKDEARKMLSKLQVD